MRAVENVAVDLFGDVVSLPSGRRGRPAHRWCQSAADRVTIGLVMGLSDQEIAFGLNISVPTLRKYYFPQLKRREMQRARFELWRAERLASMANDGNVGAMKELGKVIEKRDHRLAAERLSAMGDDRPAAPAPGKKEAARRAAAERLTGDQGDWGDDLNPGLPH